MPQLSVSPCLRVQPAGQREPRARMVEVFSSIQGEAELVGYRQIFVRTFGCNLRCSWCDSPETLFGHPPARFERTPGHRDFEHQPNPVAMETLLEAIASTRSRTIRSASPAASRCCTRGSSAPLPELRARERLPLYLETNGLLPDHLAQVIDFIDIIGMDLKPPSCIDDPLPDWQARHRRFLYTSRARKRVFAKLIVGPHPDPAEMEAAFRLIAERTPALASRCSPSLPSARSSRPPPIARCSTGTSGPAGISLTCASSRRSTNSWACCNHQPINS